MLTKQDIRNALIAERKQLTGLVESLSDDQLDAPSLCEGWSNRSVLSHILSFELNPIDAMVLIFGFKSIEAINTAGAKRYQSLSRDDYLRLLDRGLKRSLFMLRGTPSSIFNRKFIRVPNGRLSLAQLFGDLAVDRAVHYLDIAAPLGMASQITDPAAMSVALGFVFACIDLLNPKIPLKYYGRSVELDLRGLCSGVYYWTIGTDTVVAAPDQEPILRVMGETNDLIFTIAVRDSLVQSPLRAEGDHELEGIIRRSFNANALWET